MTAEPLVREHDAPWPGDDDAPGAEAARRTLAAALAAFLPATPACTDAPDDWFGGKHGSHRSAACAGRAMTACKLCPIRRPCLDVGKFEAAGVWGGVDNDAVMRARREQYNAQHRRAAAA